MGRKVSEAQWLAARQLSEIEPPTRARVAAMLGLDVSCVYHRASVEGWRTPDFRNQALAGLYREARAVAAAIATDKDGEFGAEADETDGGAAAGAADDGAAGLDGGDAEAGGSPANPQGAGAPAVPPTLTPADWETQDPVELLARASAFVSRQITRLMHNADKPDAATDETPIAFGDFGRGYLVVDRTGVRVLRDPYSAKPYVLFYTTKRVGGGVQDFNAIKLLKFGES